MSVPAWTSRSARKRRYDPGGQRGRSNNPGGFPDAEDRAYNSQLHDTLEVCLSFLEKPMERAVRGQYYENKSLKDLGRELGVSYQYARDLKNKGLRKLRGGKARRCLWNTPTRLSAERLARAPASSRGAVTEAWRKPRSNIWKGAEYMRRFCDYIDTVETTERILKD